MSSNSQLHPQRQHKQLEQWKKGWENYGLQHGRPGPGESMDCCGSGDLGQHGPPVKNPVLGRFAGLVSLDQGCELKLRFSEFQCKNVKLHFKDGVEIS